MNIRTAQKARNLLRAVWPLSSEKKNAVPQGIDWCNDVVSEAK
jgi:hypothetical protein